GLPDTPGLLVGLVGSVGLEAGYRQPLNRSVGHYLDPVVGEVLVTSAMVLAKLIAGELQRLVSTVVGFVPVDVVPAVLELIFKEADQADSLFFGCHEGSLLPGVRAGGSR